MPFWISASKRARLASLTDHAEPFARDLGARGVAAGLHRFPNEGFVLPIECGLVVHSSGI